MKLWGGRFENWNWISEHESAVVASEGEAETEEAEEEEEVEELYEGVALLARAALDSDKFFHLYLEDGTSAPLDDDPETPEVEGCIEADSTLADTAVQAVAAADPNVDTSSSTVYGVVPAPNHCYNSFRQLVQLSDQWQLHLLPFDKFYQDHHPNLQPGGIDPRVLSKIGFVFTRAVQAEVWIDQVMFYRRKPARAED